MACSAPMKAAQKKHYAKNGDVIREKAKLKAREKRAANPRYGAESVMRAKYGIGYADVEVMFSEQAGRCDCCGDPISLVIGADNYRHIDHDHDKKKGDPGFIRSLLCLHCNLAAGWVKDCPERSLKLGLYLEKHGR